MWHETMKNRQRAVRDSRWGSEISLIFLHLQTKASPKKKRANSLPSETVSRRAVVTNSSLISAKVGVTLRVHLATALLLETSTIRQRSMLYSPVKCLMFKKMLWWNLKLRALLSINSADQWLRLNQERSKTRPSRCNICLRRVLISHEVNYPGSMPPVALKARKIIRSKRVVLKILQN